MKRFFVCLFGSIATIFWFASVAYSGQPDFVSQNDRIAREHGEAGGYVMLKDRAIATGTEADLTRAERYFAQFGGAIYRSLSPPDRMDRILVEQMSYSACHAREDRGKWARGVVPNLVTLPDGPQISENYRKLQRCLWQALGIENTRNFYSPRIETAVLVGAFDACHLEAIAPPCFIPKR